MKPNNKYISEKHDGVAYVPYIKNRETCFDSFLIQCRLNKKVKVTHTRSGKHRKYEHTHTVIHKQEHDTQTTHTHTRKYTDARMRRHT